MRWLLLLPLLGACTEAPEYVYPTDLRSMKWELFSLQSGVFPFDDVMADPNNIFAKGGVVGDSKWDLLEVGAPAAAYYGWATVLVGEPTGENQFYTAASMHGVYTLETVEDPDDLWAARAIAIAGYRTVLDTFPDSVTFDATGRVGFPLAPLAYDALLQLGGDTTGWQRIIQEDGTTIVLRNP
jgi:hypothetical protein